MQDAGAAISVNLALVTSGQNEVIKNLAGWAAILAAPTLITSWYGMNFANMPESNQPWAFFDDHPPGRMCSRRHLRRIEAQSPVLMERWRKNTVPTPLL